METFWEYFDSISDKLLQREVSFRKMFQHLDQSETPVIIVETGCVRNMNPWAMSGEGHSTILFDQYVNFRNDGSTVFSVDISAEAVKVCRSLVGPKVTVHEGDSVDFLNNLTKTLKNEDKAIDLLYLDSYDVDWNYWFPSAAHHLKELLSAWRCVSKDTLVVVDDCPMNANLIADNAGQYHLDRFYKPIVGGKGRLVAEFAEQVNVPMVFSHYQHAWKGF